MSYCLRFINVYKKLGKFNASMKNNIIEMNSGIIKRENILPKNAIFLELELRRLPRTLSPTVI